MLHPHFFPLLLFLSLLLPLFSTFLFLSNYHSLLFFSLHIPFLILFLLSLSLSLPFCLSLSIPLLFLFLSLYISFSPYLSFFLSFNLFLSLSLSTNSSYLSPSKCEFTWYISIYLVPSKLKKVASYQLHFFMLLVQRNMVE